jgi:hypothetical protein
MSQAVLTPFLSCRFDRISSLESDTEWSTKKPHMELCAAVCENIFALFGYVCRLHVTNRVVVIHLIYQNVC